MSTPLMSRFPVAEQYAPRWTELPPLALRGVGTSEVESLQYYFERMVLTTGAPAKCLRQYINSLAQGKCGSYSRFHLIVDSLAQRRIEQFERLTGVDTLRYGTLWALSDVLSPNCSMYGAHRRRWCPRCYEDWEEGRSYEPLAWNIDLLSDCPKHGCRLEYACSNCKNFQRDTSRSWRRRICRVCGSSLATGAVWRKRPPFVEWVDKQVLELVEFCATPRTQPMPWSDYVTFASGVRSNARHGERLKRSLRLLLHSVDQKARWLTSRPSIRTLINLCSLQGCSMSELLNAPREASGPLLLDFWSDLDRMPLPRAIQAQSVYVAVRCLEEVISASLEYLPPLDLLLSPFNIRDTAVRDAFSGPYDRYEASYIAQESPSQLASLRRAYLFAVCTREAATESDRVEIITEIADISGVDLSVAARILSVSSVVRKCQSTESVQKYRSEMPVREAVEWLLGRWSSRA